MQHFFYNLQQSPGREREASEREAWVLHVRKSLVCFRLIKICSLSPIQVRHGGGVARAHTPVGVNAARITAAN